MKNVLIFGGLAIIGYVLYNKFGKKDKSNLGLGGALSMQTNTPSVETPSALIDNVLTGDIDNNKINVIDTVTIERPTNPKKGKFTPNRPIGRPRITGNCQCITTPCNC
jgi:hypothetical protein